MKYDEEELEELRLSTRASDEAPPSKDDPLQEFISRNDTAALLTLTASGVRYFEKSWLTVRRIIGRTVHYHRRQVDDLLMAREEAKSGVCFAAFRAGIEPTEVVAKHGLYPPMVERCYEQYLRLRRKEGVLVIDPGPDLRGKWLNALGLKKPPDGAWIRRAVELVVQSPALRERCERASLSARKLREQREGKGNDDDED